MGKCIVSMKSKISTLLLGASLIAFSALGSMIEAPVVSAACENGGTSAGVGVEIGNEQKGDCAKETSFAFADCGKDEVSISCVVKAGLVLLSGIVGIAVVGGIIWGGIVYSTSKGSPAGIQKGRTIIGNSLLALVLYALMYAIIQFLLPGGTLTK